MKSLNAQSQLTIILALLSLYLNSCSYYRYILAQEYYEQRKYTYALESVNKAIAENSQNPKYLYFKTKIVATIYIDHNFPLLAYHYLSSYESTIAPHLSTKQYFEYLESKKSLAPQIKQKFTIPIVFRSMTHTPELDTIKNNLIEKLRNSDTNNLYRFLISPEDKIENCVIFEIQSKPLFNLTKKATNKFITSKYLDTIKKIRNIDYDLILYRYRSLRKKRARLLQEYTQHASNRELSYLEFLSQARSTMASIRRNQRDIDNIVRQLDSTDAYLEKSILKDYQFKENATEYYFTATLKFRLTDSHHLVILEEDEIKLTRMKQVKNYSGLHPNDISYGHFPTSTYEYSEDFLSENKKIMHDELQEKLVELFKKIPYYRANMHSRKNLISEAWENYYIFLQTASSDNEAILDASRFIQENQLPLDLMKTIE
jgi:hypothetical protein